MSFLDRVKSWFEPHRRLQPGIYHYQTPPDAPQQYRLHLRIEKDGHGVLLINAARVLHLNQTAAEHAKLLLEGKSDLEAAQEIARRYDVPLTTARADFEELQQAITEIAEGGEEICPVSYLDIARIEPMSAKLSAPYRMDLALTYRCNNDCRHCYNARLRTYPELSTQEWKKVIDRCWELSIPHLIFTGGEPTLREDLAELIRYAENNGQITGLNTNGRRLRDENYVKELVDAGLDHVQITLESHLEEIHDQMVNLPGAWVQTVAGLQNALNSPLYVMTNTTMLKDNFRTIGKTLDFLGELGVPTVGLNALIYSGRGKDVGTGLSEDELKPLLTLAKQKTQDLGQKLIWYTPTLYCHFNPLEMDLGIKGCTAALYNMCVEPDGGVIPCQSYYHQLGNLLHDSWKSIWEHDLALKLRERSYVPDECQTCSLLEECGAGCPLAYAEQPRKLDPIIPPAN